MKSKILTLSLSAALLSTSFLSFAGSVAPKREFRSTWFTTHVNIDWPQTRGTSASVVAKQKADMVQYIEGFEKMNLNGACFQVRAQCDAVYKSSYEPWSAVITGTRGTDPGWDPLEYCIEECHKRGLECYAWINPFRWSTGTDYNTPQDKAVKEKGWILSYGGYYVLNPAIPEAREHILKVCKEIIDNYAIDGVLFDDYFYPNNIPENSTAGDWNLYKASGTTMSIGDWRRENINIFVRDFQKMIEESHPDMRFGISPAGVAGASASKFGIKPCPVAASDWQYSTIYSDPLAWLSDGSIDFISPQIYWQTYHSTAPYEPLCDWWSYVAEHFGRHFYSSHNVYFFTSTNNSKDWEEVAKQVRLNREYAEPSTLKAPGSIYYSSKYFYGPALTGLGDYLLGSVNKTKALVPVVNWKKVPTFGTPENLQLTGSKLTWKAIDAPNSIMRYTVYAVPNTLSFEEALEDNGDGISNDYLLKVWYDTAFELSADAQGDFWYAVCAYDGLGNEFEPAIVNYPQGESPAVALLSPADGAVVAWNQAFSWSSVADARYVLRIASDEKFSDIVYTSEKLSEASATPDMSELSPLTRYYWSVTCYESGKLGTPSQVQSFTTPDYVDAPKVTLLTPGNGTTVEGDITFSWKGDSSLDSYTLEVSKDADFSTIRYSATPSATSLKVNPSLIGKGEYFWRVRATGPFMRPSVSDSFKFTIESLAIGEFEPGYVVRQDEASYKETDGVRVENLWLRSNNNGFNNIQFNENGLMERSMVAVGEFVYLTRRSENSQGATLFLEQYDGLTGEHIKTITLGDEARVGYFPLNTVMRDDSDNLVVANLVLDAVSSPLYLHRVDLATGNLTEIAKISLTGEKARVDHVNVTGDVVSGNFNVYFAIASGNTLVRVSYKDGVQTEIKKTTVNEFYPSDRSSFAIAPFVTPVSFDEVLVNGGGTGLGRYNLALGKLVEGIGVATTANGSDFVTLGNNIYTVYPSSDHSSAFRFDIVKSGAGSFAGATTVATVPEAGLGTINSSTSATPVSIVPDADGSARIYVYAVGNGIAAYRLTDANAGGVSDAVSGLTYSVVGRDIIFSQAVSSASVYSPSGVLIARGADTNALSVSVAGIYILVADGLREKLVVK